MTRDRQTLSLSLPTRETGDVAWILSPGVFQVGTSPGRCPRGTRLTGSVRVSPRGDWASVTFGEEVQPSGKESDIRANASSLCDKVKVSRPVDKLRLVLVTAPEPGDGQRGQGVDTGCQGRFRGFWEGFNSCPAWEVDQA